ncbi:MAG: hypothetical protein ACREQ7_07480 [Candidatus Binatia bacterium]
MDAKQNEPLKSLVLASTTCNLFPVLAFLKDNPDRQLIIMVGDDCDPGSYPDNPAESAKRRVELVRKFFVHNGISPERIIAPGQHDAYAVASGSRANAG